MKKNRFSFCNVCVSAHVSVPLLALVSFRSILALSWSFGRIQKSKMANARWLPFGSLDLITTSRASKQNSLDVLTILPSLTVISLRSKRFQRAKSYFPVSGRTRNRASAKKREVGERGSERKETLADRPRFFENFRSPTNEGFWLARFEFLIDTFQSGVVIYFTHTDCRQNYWLWGSSFEGMGDKALSSLADGGFCQNLKEE